MVEFFCFLKGEQKKKKKKKVDNFDVALFATS
jgi:hypothetical protein